MTQSNSLTLLGLFIASAAATWAWLKRYPMYSDPTNKSASEVLALASADNDATHLQKYDDYLFRRTSDIALRDPLESANSLAAWAHIHQRLTGGAASPVAGDFAGDTFGGDSGRFG